MPFGFDDAALLLGSAIVGGFGGAGKGEKAEALDKILADLQSNKDYLTSTPFSKDEIMSQLLPMVQKTFRGAADVAAGRIGSSIGEAGSAGGQAFGEFFTQSLAPIIAQGENLAAGATSDFAKFFAQLDSDAKNRLLQSIGLEINATQGLPNTSEFERVISGALGGLDLGANALGSFKTASALQTQVDNIGKRNPNAVNSTSNIGGVNLSGSQVDKLVGQL